MNIREHAQAVIRVYLDGFPSLKSDFSSDETLNANLELSKSHLNAIAVAVGVVADGASEDAARLQQEILGAMGEWAHCFANGLSSTEALTELERAVILAREWASLPDPNAKKGGIFSLFSKKKKMAEEGSYLTYEKAIKSADHRRMLIHSKYSKAKMMVDTFARLISIFRDTTATEDARSIAEMEETYHLFVHYLFQKEVLISLTDCLDFVVMIKIIEQTATSRDIQDFVTGLNRIREMANHLSVSMVDSTNEENFEIL